MTRVLGVHGVGNYQARRTPDAAARRLATVWESALQEGLGPEADLDVRVAYYASHLRAPVAQSAAEPELLSPVGAAMLTEWATLLGAPNSVVEGYPTAPLRQIAEWVAQRFGLDTRLVRTFVAVFFREVAAYLGEDLPGGRTDARNAVAAAIRAHRPRVLVAHSLGSVVAYEALCAHDDLDIDLLLTVGSPLGMPNIVLDRIDPAPATSSGLRNRVGEWLNIADVGDLVALPPRLHGVYDVDADHLEHIHLFDFHRVTNYLRCSRVAAAVGAFLTPR
jgi:hypothetical protein